MKHIMALNLVVVGLSPTVGARCSATRSDQITLGAQDLSHSHYEE